jgi:hypothetical protein
MLPLAVVANLGSNVRHSGWRGHAPKSSRLDHRSTHGRAFINVCFVSPQADPGFVWDAFVSSPNTVTVRLTCFAAGTPIAFEI